MASNGEILRLVLEYTYPPASMALNVFTWLISAGAESDANTMDDFETWIDALWGPDWADMAQLAAYLTRFALDVVAVDGTVTRNLGSRNIGLQGTDTGEIGVAAIAAYLKADTNIPKTRGSKYIPGLGEVAVAVGYLNGETIGDLAVLLGHYVSVYLGVTSETIYTPGVVSRTLQAFVPFNQAGYFTDVPAYQRRRKPNVGS